MEQTLTYAFGRDTIAAVSTAPGAGGIAVIRLSGEDALGILSKCWKGADLNKIVSHTAHLGKIVNQDGEPLDEAVIIYYKGPRSFTGEDVVEISCHGSRWIQREIVNLLTRCGARPAEPGEFTQRAYINGRLDLAQAEGVIDLISSSSRAAHRLAMQQTSGRFSGYLNNLREQLIDLASLLELELDFSEEDVEFADRSKLRQITADILTTLSKLAKTFAAGKALKEGIPVVIAGAPNAGKSTLLNTLLDDEKAIVSDIPGTTRDIIEDTAEIDGVLFRFADTAGLREASDEIERIGIQRAEDRLRKARIILWLVDITAPDHLEEFENIKVRINALPDAKHILLLNKSDLSKAFSSSGTVTESVSEPFSNFSSIAMTGHLSLVRSPHSPLAGADEEKAFDAILSISASSGDGIEELKTVMVKEGYGEYDPESDVMLTNTRHYAAVLQGIAALRRVAAAIAPTGSSSQIMSADMIAQDVREAIHHLSTLTGAISTPDLLTTIFSRFCIGK